MFSHPIRGESLFHRFMAHASIKKDGSFIKNITGCETIVRDAVAKWRKGWNLPVTTAARLLSVYRVSRWLMPWRIIRGEENYASRFISLMCEKEPELKIAQQLALEFYRILKTQNKSQLSCWFTRVHESGSAELRRVAAAMCEAISSRWSNGVVEGHVNRLKMLKRQMYGRAGFESRGRLGKRNLTDGFGIDEIVFVAFNECIRLGMN